MSQPVLKNSNSSTTSSISSVESLEQKNLLLSLNDDIVSIFDKASILTTLHPKLKRLFNTEDIFICLLDKEGVSIEPFLRVYADKRNNNPDYRTVIESKFPSTDRFFDIILKSDGPVYWDLEETCRWEPLPGYLKASWDADLRYAISCALRRGNEAIGIFTIWAESENRFWTHHESVVQQVSKQLSIALGNVLTHESIQQRDIENEVLLTVSNEVANVRQKSDLTKVFSGTLRQYLKFDHAAIMIYRREQNCLNVFAHYVNERLASDPEITAGLTFDYPVFDTDTSSAHIPTFLDVESLAAQGKTGVNFILNKGVKEIANVKLVDGEVMIGLFVLMSERKGHFTLSSRYILQRISFQLSIAIAKLVVTEQIENREREKDILLTIGKELASIRNKVGLLPLLKEQLGRFGFYSDITVAKVDQDKSKFSAFLNHEDSDRRFHEEWLTVRDAHHTFPDGVFEVALKSKRPVIFNVEELVREGKAPNYVKFLHDTGTVEMVGISLHNGNDEIGALFCFSNYRKKFTELQLNLAQAIGHQIGIAIANILANEEIRARESEKSVLLALSQEIATVRTKDNLFNVLKTHIQDLFCIDGFGIALMNEKENTYSAYLINAAEQTWNDSHFKDVIAKEYFFPDGIFDRILSSEDPLVIVLEEIEPPFPAYIEYMKQRKIKSLTGARLRVSDVNLGCIYFNRDESLYPLSSNLVKGVCAQISIAISNVLSNEKIERQLQEIKQFQRKLEEEKIYLQEEVEHQYVSDDVIGASAGMQDTLRLVSQVSHTNSSVLLLGETGTGKEVIARTIHSLSPRQEKLMVKVNCASIPATLIESELFGHEKGSFTGAIQTRIGKFELADNGTLFLDEIGELPLEMQPKFLRALQEQEIERIGGKSVIKINVRIIAATNRNLEEMIQQGKFRSDLYYRLNVFPITIPPLRQRKEDIPNLAMYFLKRFSKNTGKSVSRISPDVVRELVSYQWPGNVRELEHLMERSVIMTTTNTVSEIHLPGRQNVANRLPGFATHEQNERNYFIQILEQCKGKVYGQGGAAELLDLKVSTLHSKLKKLGINPKDYSGKGKL